MSATNNVCLKTTITLNIDLGCYYYYIVSLTLEHKENDSILTLSRRKTNWEPGSKNSLINNVLRENNDVKFREMLFDPTGPDNTIPCTSARWRRVQYQLSMLFHLASLLEKEFKRELYK